jgi:replicative DNA helicase
MEMGRDLFIERQVTNLARVPFTRAKSGRLQDSEKKRLLEQATELSKRDIYVEGTSLITPAGVEQTLMEARDNKIPLNLVCIDHLHYMKMHKGEWSIGDEIAQITKYLKALARTYDVPLLLLCQLNRGPEYREDHRPMLNDLRDSGSIEQDADQVWFLYRDSYYSRSAQETTEAEIIVAKQRNGPPGTVKVMWSGPLMSFSEPVKMNLTDF